MNPPASDPLLTVIEQLLSQGAKPQWPTVLDHVLTHFDCPVGSVHLLEKESGMLKLEAQRGLPPPVIDKVLVIPIGKGMAGLAAERRQPVQLCNLQRDESGIVPSGAKLTKMSGSLAAPMLNGNHLAGVFGIAKPHEYEFSADETNLLMAIGARLAKQLGTH